MDGTRGRSAQGNLPATRLSLQGSGNTLRTGHDRGGAWAEPSRA